MRMKQKSTAKHKGKKSPAPKGASSSSAPDLFPPVGGSKTLPGAFAKAAQLFPYTGLDDAALRRRAAETNPATGAPWIPAARGGRWPVHDTLAGLLAWRTHQHATAESRGLPAICGSMKDVEAIHRIPVEMQQYAREHYHPQAGDPIIFESSNRVHIPPMAEFFYPLLKKIFSGGGNQIAGLQGFEDLDLDFQRALSTKEDVIAKKRDNGLANQDLYVLSEIEKQLGEPLTYLGNEWKTA